MTSFSTARLTLREMADVDLDDMAGLLVATRHGERLISAANLRTG